MQLNEKESSLAFFATRCLHGIYMNGTKWRIFLIFVPILFLTGSCTPKNYTEVSTEAPYSSSIGSTFKSEVELLAIGVTFDQNYEGDADYVFLMARPGIGGPQVKFRKLLPKGVQLRVVGVFKSHRVFGQRILYRVEIKGDPSFETYPIMIKLFDDISSSNRGLDVEEFVFIGRESLGNAPLDLR